MFFTRELVVLLVVVVVFNPTKHHLAYTETFSAKTETLSAKTEQFSAKTELLVLLGLSIPF
jgi:hypothetical protein